MVLFFFVWTQGEERNLGDGLTQKDTAEDTRSPGRDSKEESWTSIHRLDKLPLLRLPGAPGVFQDVDRVIPLKRCLALDSTVVPFPRMEVDPLVDQFDDVPEVI